MDVLGKMATFVRVVEAGSFSAAARQLRLSPAAVSRQISTLEGELRVPLLLRTTRRTAVTPAGRRYYERCLRILRDVDDAQAIGQGESPDGLLVVTAPVTFGLARVVPHLPALLQQHPRLLVDLKLEDRLIDLALEGVDVAIRVGAPPPESLDVVAHPLFSFHRVLVAAPSYLKRRGEPKTPEALARHDALTYASGEYANVWTVGDGQREARVQLAVRFRSNAPHALHELALAGSGVALLPAWLVTKDLRHRALRHLLPRWRTDEVMVHALHRTAHRGAPRVRALIEHLRACYAARE
jgi:DNA-binding transcriptional LysR family regulator